MLAMFPSHTKVGLFHLIVSGHATIGAQDDLAHLQHGVLERMVEIREPLVNLWVGAHPPVLPRSEGA
jgi:hypothetical protein